MTAFVAYFTFPDIISNFLEIPGMTGGEPREPDNQRGEENFDVSTFTSNEVGGVVYGPSVQAREIHGDVHIHQPAAMPQRNPIPRPSQLPPSSPLTGRDADVLAMDTARSSRVILLTGPPGVGKTALAVTWAHAVR